MFIKDSVVFKNKENTKNSFFCAVCKFPLVSQQDFLKHAEYNCCQKCFLDFVESRKDDWISGWRPERNVLRDKINFRKQVMLNINNK